jgi:very-short-patch-repair endonuclease
LSTARLWLEGSIHTGTVGANECGEHPQCLGMDSDREVNSALRAQGGALRRSDRPELCAAIDWLVRQGELAALLPGVYSVPDWRQNPAVGMRAAMLRHPDGVLIGAAAAKASYWPSVKLDRIDVAVPRKVTAREGFAFNRRSIPADLVVERQGLRFTDPALTAVDLAAEERADSIDIALRTRAATLAGMRDALARTPNRSGNRTRLKLLIDSRDEPWSAAERRAHRLLRGAGIMGWQSNLPVIVNDQLYYLDIAFRGRRLALEIDGRMHEDDPGLFESDRWRQNALVFAGWRVLRFTWAMLDRHPESFVDSVLRALT